MIRRLGYALLVLLTLGSATFFGTESAWASRLPTPSERNELRLAISRIAATSRYPAAAVLLQKKLAQGALKIEDGWTDGTQGLTNYPIRGTQTITIASQIIPKDENPGIPDNYWAATLWEDRTWLASILVHEWLHTTQSWLYVRTHFWNVEPPAWSEQIVFLKQRLAEVQADPLYRGRAESLVDRAEFALALATGAVHEWVGSLAE